MQRRESGGSPLKGRSAVQANYLPAEDASSDGCLEGHHLNKDAIINEISLYYDGFQYLTEFQNVTFGIIIKIPVSGKSAGSAIMAW